MKQKTIKDYKLNVDLIESSLGDKNHTDLAKMLGVTKMAVSYWMNDQKFPRLDPLSKISAILDISINDLIIER